MHTGEDHHRRPRGSSSSDGGGSLSMKPAATQTASSSAAEHHLEHEFPNLKTCHPDVQTEEDRRAGYFGSGPSTLAERPGDHGPICDCSPEQLGPTVL
jgi:hypothetical protein